MSLAKKTLSPEAAAKVQAALAQTDWEKQYPHPHQAERLTAWRAAKEAITARVLADLATAQARRQAAQEREAQAELARWQPRGDRMVTSTAQGPSGLETLTPARVEAMDAAIATLQAQGQAITASRCTAWSVGVGAGSKRISAPGVSSSARPPL